MVPGKKFSYYVDTCRATFHHETGSLVGHVMLDMFEEAGFGAGVADVVGGLMMGADPVATVIMHVVASHRFDVDALVARKEAKDHGTKRRVEGSSIEGHNIVILENTSTIDDSPIQALEAAHEAGTNVLAVAVVVDRAIDAKEKIETCGIPYLAALGLEDLGLGVQA